MRFSEAWLREWVNPSVDTQALADRFSMAGLEVDSVAPAAPAFTGVVVGEVLQKAQHPDADKLSVCQVEVGAGEPLQIVCGAKNVAAGMRVPVALVGAALPGDFKIKRSKLRGVESLGMICSATELGLAESSEGILPLPADAPVGQDIRDYLGLDDALIEIDLTPDRGDCNGILGLAREVSALCAVPVMPPVMPAIAPVNDAKAAVEVAAPDACPRYACRVIRNVDPKAGTPLWMKERLRRSDIRSIAPIVDVTNYLMLELGQPMHAFDLGRIQGGIRVRMAETGEKLTLLDGKEIELLTDSLVIADYERPLALAGVMGGADSGVSAGTTDILLESAYFAPLAIAGKARAYGLHTDSSYRFERGVDPSLQARAIERATALLLEIVGGEPGPLVDVVHGNPALKPVIQLRRDRIRRILGIEIPDSEVTGCLERLGMQVETSDGGWRVTPPACRFDIAIEVDLIEEIGRIHGFENIPSNSPRIPMTLAIRPERELDLDALKQRLIGLGYQEVITYSFIEPQWAAAVVPGVETIPLANPISAEMSAMRPSLWPGLIACARHNFARQQPRVRVFENGLQFQRRDGEILQEPILAGLVSGDCQGEQWGLTGRPVDFFDMKADLENLLRLGGEPESYRFEAVEHPVLHPGQSAGIFRDGVLVGHLGMLHPRLAAEWDLDKNLFLFELRLAAIREGGLPAFRPLSKFPSIRRDIALVIDREIGFGAVKKCVRSHGTEILRDIILFDVYTGEKVDSGRKSLAFGLILQDSSRTLTELDVEEAMTGILSGLTNELGAQLRD
ncbi:MAG: phenylalanine--tRNA ligase subunit beta [Gammaproteobacteria bacterium]|nr:phenylalanine--tRNA ligase subunit beta [Gammaproteobacteria bacterium]MBU1655535.1 phenylalanine--tRNA ligase subunit beta [Gammaproteobacteria bacterium]MBU1961283.1 phenylalanine--tRNA ligase subunit beta [Gammaproteobacteria bacterium]